MSNKRIRVGTWESNSSSSHSISLGRDENLEFVLDTIIPDDEGIIHINGGEYGWEYDKFNDPLIKATYACQQLSDSLDTVIQVIKDVTGAEDVVVNITDGYIDHESIGIVTDDYEYLKDFIFNRNSWLFTGNDNTETTPDFYVVPKFTQDGGVEEQQIIMKISIPTFDKVLNYRTEYSESEIISHITDTMYGAKVDENGNKKNPYARGNEQKFRFLEYVDLKDKNLYFINEEYWKDETYNEISKTVNYVDRPKVVFDHFMKSKPEYFVKVPFFILK